MDAASKEYSVENSALGRIVIAPSVPAGFALFYTTFDIDGRLDPERANDFSELLRGRFGSGAALTTCTQVHGRDVVHAATQSQWRECDSCDALWSDHPGSALGIKVADCLPVSMIDPRRHVIANVHSGWRGTVQRIVDATLDTLGSSSAFSPADAYAYLGPSIRVCCFEVGEEVVEQFLASDPDAARFVDRSRAKPHVDIPALTSSRLAARGFRPERVFDSGLCTRCEGSIFHSYRRERGSGRNLAIVAME